MSSILVRYGTGEGQTARVAERIVDVLAGRGHEATVVDVGEPPEDLDVRDFDAVLVGASIHYGRRQRAVRRSVAANRDALAAKPNGFLQVSGSSARGGGSSGGRGVRRRVRRGHDWRPDRIGLFGGALRFSEYGFLVRALVKRIARSEFPDADTSGDVEFTDWEEVEGFAEGFAAFVEERLGAEASGSETV